MFDVGELPAAEAGLPDDVLSLYGQLHELLDRIGKVSTVSATESDLVTAAIEHERAAHRLASLGHQRVMDVSDRDAHRAAGYRSLRQFVSLGLHEPFPTRRLRRTDALCEHYSMLGEKLPARLPTTAAALAAGTISEAHADVIIDIDHKIPAATDPVVRANAETQLAELAVTLPIKDLTAAGRRVLAHLDPDGAITDDADRARQRGLTVGHQDPQLMSRLTGVLDPTTRAMLDVVLAAWAAKGMNNPDDHGSPTGADAWVDAEAVAAAAERDTRTDAQRRHDALAALLRAGLDGGILGHSHRGLPPHVIVTLTESELRERAGLGVTTAGTDLPIGHIIELAARSQMHLAVFADHTSEPLYLGRSARLANQSQRFMLFAGYHGCSHPDCAIPFIHTEIHHAKQDWADGGHTDITDLAPACGPHNRAVGTQPGDYTTGLVTTGPDTGRYAWTRNTNGVGPPEPPRVNHIHDVAYGVRNQIAGAGSPHNNAPNLPAGDREKPCQPDDPLNGKRLRSTEKRPA